MCGLFGAVGWVTEPRLGMVYDLSTLAMFRGTHSTGLAVYQREDVPKNQKKNPKGWLYHKDTEPAFEFMSQDVVQDMLDLKKRTIFAILGHTRLATVGSVSKENAHPHKVKHILGCHNGTIDQFTYSIQHKEIGSDSKVLFHKIAEEGMVPALKAASRGAYALSYVDLSSRKLHFIRNEERPLFFVVSQDKKTIFWASEERMLKFLIAPIQLAEVTPLPPYTLLTVDPLTLKTETEDLREDLATKVYTFPAETMEKEDQKDFLEQREKAWEEYLDRREHQRSNTSPLPQYQFSGHRQVPTGIMVYGYQGHRGTWLTLREAKHILDDGCMNCGTVVPTSKPVTWVDSKAYLCETCIKEDVVMACHAPDLNDKGHIIVRRLEKKGKQLDA